MSQLHEQQQYQQHDTICDLVSEQQPELGTPVPQVDHAISVMLPTWDDICEMFTGAPRVKNAQQTGYPRSFVHQDVAKLNKIVLQAAGRPNDSVWLFREQQYAKEAVLFASSSQVHGDKATPPECFSVRSFRLHMTEASSNDSGLPESVVLHGVFVPADKIDWLKIYWRTWGTGISSRFAEDCHLGKPRVEEITAARRGWTNEAYDVLCERIAGLANGPPAAGTASVRSRSRGVDKDDIYLYPTGMAAISQSHALATSWKGAGTTVVFGFPYELTPKILEMSGPPIKLYPFATRAEMDELERFLEAKSKTSERVQAVWCECPSNPLLQTPDFVALKRVTNKYGAALIVDDTIGGFANIDMIDVADVIVTSLTKSFSGYADVMGGSIMLSPSSPFYQLFKCRLDASYNNQVHTRDLAKLELNSRDFVSRTRQLNGTASYLVRMLSAFQARHPETLREIYYPEVNWSAGNYAQIMRLPSSSSSSSSGESFTAGHGCLFTLEFGDLQTAICFFNNLRGVSKGPSLGANVTLVQPYVQTVFHKEKDFAARCGLDESIVRVSVGLENAQSLLQYFLAALAVAHDDRSRRLAASGADPAPAGRKKEVVVMRRDSPQESSDEE